MQEDRDFGGASEALPLGARHSVRGLGYEALEIAPFRLFSLARLARGGGGHLRAASGVSICTFVLVKQVN